jgi:hypothetical protein
MWQKLSNSFKNPEFVIWTAALIYLGGFSQMVDAPFTLCIPSLFGFDGCLGCGVGRSIAEALHGDFIGSFELHPFGILAISAILVRMVNIYNSANRVVQPYQVPPSPLQDRSENAQTEESENDKPI